MNQWEEDFERKPGRTLWKGAALFIVGVGGLIIVGALTGVVTMPFRTAVGVAERTFNPDNAIYNYEWFKRQRQDVIAFDQKIASAQLALDSFTAAAGDRSKWTFEDKTEWSRLNSVILGLRNQRAGMVAEYNARTEMANRDIFRTGDLPETLN
jgi:hypothetical protein